MGSALLLSSALSAAAGWTAAWFAYAILLAAAAVALALKRF